MACLKKGWHFPCPSSMVTENCTLIMVSHSETALMKKRRQIANKKERTKRKGQCTPTAESNFDACMVNRWRKRGKVHPDIHTHKNKQCIGAMKYRSKAGIVHWKHLRLHKYRPKSSGIWPLKTKKVHASPSSKKDSRYSTASCNKFYDSLTNANTKARQDNNVVVTDHSKPNSTCQSIWQENKALSQSFLSEALRLFHNCEKRTL